MLSRPSNLGGPVPKFNDYHIWKAFQCLDETSPVGRKKLSQLLGIGEGSTRTILSMMQDQSMITIGKSGILLTEAGAEFKKSVHMDVADVSISDLTIGDRDCAVRVPKMARNVKYGCEERDAAIKSGATSLKNDDVVIIGTGPTEESAEIGAVIAGLTIMGGLQFNRELKDILTQRSTGNELLSLAFAIHDLVGGLPVCAKSRDNLGIRIENGAVIDNAYSGPVLEEVINAGTTIRKIATAGPYKGIRVIVTPIELDNRIIAAIGVVDIRSMAGINNLIRLRSDDNE